MVVNWKLTNAALIVTLAGVLVAGNMHEQTRSEQTREQFKTVTAVEQSAPIEQKEITPLTIAFDDYEHVMLFGDQTMTGFNNKEIEENPIVFEADDIIHHEVSHLPHTWANAFREYVQTSYPNVSFTNAAIKDKSATWFNAHKDDIVLEDDTVALVMLGTNDRWAASSIEEYKEQYREFLQHIQAQARETIVMISPPSLTDDYDMMNFTMADVAQATKELCEEQGLSYISLYDAIYDAAERQQRDLVSYLQADGPHLTDVGNDIVWAYMKNYLSLQ